MRPELKGDKVMLVRLLLIAIVAVAGVMGKRVYDEMKTSPYQGQ